MKRIIRPIAQKFKPNVQFAHSPMTSKKIYAQLTKSAHTTKSVIAIQKRYISCSPDNMLLDRYIDFLDNKYSEMEINFCKTGSLIYKIINNIALNELDEKDLKHIEKKVTIDVITIKEQIEYMESYDPDDYLGIYSLPQTLKTLECELRFIEAKNFLFRLMNGEKLNDDDNILDKYKKYRNEY